MLYEDVLKLILAACVHCKLHVFQLLSAIDLTHMEGNSKLHYCRIRRGQDEIVSFTVVTRVRVYAIISLGLTADQASLLRSCLRQSRDNFYRASQSTSRVSAMSRFDFQ